MSALILEILFINFYDINQMINYLHEIISKKDNQNIFSNKDIWNRIILKESIRRDLYS